MHMEKMINRFQPKDDRIVYKHNQLALVKSVGRWYQCDFYLVLTWSLILRPSHRIHVHLEHENVTFFVNKVCADVIKFR